MRRAAPPSRARSGRAGLSLPSRDAGLGRRAGAGFGLGLGLSLGLVAGAAHAGPGGGSGTSPAPAAPHTFTFDDLMRLVRVDAPQLSPDGQVLYFSQSRARLDVNRWQGALYAMPVGPARGPAQRLTFPERGQRQDGQDFAPQLSPDGQRLAFLSTRDGGAPQLYVLRVAGGAAGIPGGEAQRVSSVAGGVSSFQWTPDGRAAIIQASVYPECPAYPAPTAEECNKGRAEAHEKNPVRARLIDRLFYRHWDDWYDGKRSHLLRLMLPDGSAQKTASAPAMQTVAPGTGQTAATGPDKNGGSGQGPGAAGLLALAAAPLVDLTPGDYDTPPIARAGSQPFSLSPDGRELAYVQNRDKELASSTNHDVWLLSLGKDFVPAGQPRDLTPKNLAADTAPRFSPDGRFLAYTAQRRAGFEADRFELWLYDRVTGQFRSLTQSFDAQVDEPVWSPDSQRLYFATNQKGRGAIFSVEISGKQAPVQLTTGDSHDLSIQRSGDGATLVFLRSSLLRPSEVYRLELDAQGKPTGPAQVLTHQNDAVFADVKLGAPSQLFAKSADGLSLHSHLVTPPDFSPAKKYPAVVLVHGGPQGAWEDLWQWRWCAQMFAGAGYVVLMPNPRGSEGFGQRFTDQISGDWGGRAYDDVMRSVDQLVAQPYVDGKRVAAAGASYGGYLVNWIAGHTDRFAALVSHAGVYDLRSMYGETEEIWFPRWEFQGDPWQNPNQYDKWSPARYADKFKTPMLVISNERDYRVPLGQGMQLFTALQIRKVPSRMLIFPDENHWVLKPLNARLWYATVLDWLHTYVGGAAVDPKFIEQAGTYAK